jgi:hypothetical protein
MAGDKGYIDEFIQGKAIDGIGVATKKLEALLAIIVKTADASNKINFNAGGGTSSSTIKQLSEEERLLDKLTKTSKNYGSETERLKVQISHLAAENKILAKEQVGMLSLHDKLAISHKKAERAAIEVGIQYGVTSQKFKEAAAAANVMYKQLTTLEQSLGNYKRGVGQYSNAVFGLSQVLREMPAFTYSAQMGVMALGNNLPILADNFKQVMKSTDDATGKINGFGGAIKIFARSIFSFVNIFTIAIGLFTIFYDEIFKGGESLEKFADSLDNSAKSAIKASNEVESLRGKIKLAKEGIISKEEAIKSYNETIGQTIGEVTTWGELENRMIDDAAKFIKVQELKARAVDALTESITLRKKADSIEENGLGFMDKLKALPFIPLTAIKMMFNAGGAIEDISKAQSVYKENIVKEIKDLAAAKKLTFEILELKIAELSKGFTGGSKGKKAGSLTSSSNVKEVNRIEELKKEYDKERSIQELAFKRGEIGYIKYQENILAILEKYTNLRKKKLPNETEAEADSGLNFDLKIADDTIDSIKEATNAIIELRKAEAYTGKDASKAIGESAKPVPIPQGSTATVSFNKSDLRDKMSIRDMIESIGAIGNALQSLSGVSDAIFEREMQRFDIRERRLQDQYDNELRFIEQTGLSAAQKEKKKQQLERETEAAKKKIDKDRLAATVKQAKLNKAFAVAEVTFNTAMAITAALTLLNPISKAINVAAAIATGIAQLAKIAITPLPQYAKGRNGGDAEFAIVSENGQEARRSADGTISLLPKTKSVVFLNKGDDVIPHHELIKSKAFITLSKKNETVSAHDFQLALLMAYEKQTSEIKTLQKILIDKNFSIKNNGDDLMNMYKKQFIG